MKYYFLPLLVATIAINFFCAAAVKANPFIIKRDTIIKVANQINTKRIIKNFILNEKNINSEYVFANDTLINTLLQIGKIGIYSFGRGRTSHMRSSYSLVFKYKKIIKYFTLIDDKKKATKEFFDFIQVNNVEVSDKKRASIIKSINNMVKSNNISVNSDVF